MFGIALVVVLVIANGFFVATEFAIVAVRKSRLEQLAAEGRRGAKAAQQLTKRLDVYLAACQFGITIASLALGWVGEPAFAHLIEPVVRKLAGHDSRELADVIGVILAFTLITGLHIVAGELAPKGLALQKTEGTVLFVARPMRVFYVIFRWPITVLNFLGNSALRLVGIKTVSEAEAVHSVEEVRYLLAGMRDVGEVEDSEAEIASRAFNFADQDAAELMTPRPDVTAVSIDAAAAHVVETFSTSGHSRLPVFQDSLDNVVGVVRVHDVLEQVASDQFDLMPILQAVSVVPETLSADRILEHLRKERRQLAVVIDEHGGTSGVITLEDLFEALVGDIAEDDRVGDVDHINAVSDDGSFLVDGRTSLHELEESFHITLDDRVRAQVDTLGGVVMFNLGRVPTVGDSIMLSEYSATVEVMDGMRVANVRIRPTEA